jgi:Double zinc ribbon
MSDHLDPRHLRARSGLRVVGLVVALVGLVFTIIGLVSFFASFGTGEPPRSFWCAFVGLPLLGVGAAICKFAYLGSISRYMANEVAPVGKDVVNYMARGTKGAVRDMAAAVGEGLRSGEADEARPVRCPKCDAANGAGSNFCAACGAPLTKAAPCPSCGGLVDPGARFCPSCGQAVV